MKEIWKKFPYPELGNSYEVSNFGQVRSVDRTVMTSVGYSRFFKGITLKQTIDKSGYYRITTKLRNPRRDVSYIVSRVVAEAFCEKPLCCDVVNHLDGNKLNNNASNLEWTTVSGNTQHSFDNGLQKGKKGSDHKFSELSELDVADIISRLSKDQTQLSIAKMYGVSKATIGKINRGSSWIHVSVHGLVPPYSSGSKSKYHRYRG